MMGFGSQGAVQMACLAAALEEKLSALKAFGLNVKEPYYRTNGLGSRLRPPHQMMNRLPSSLDVQEVSHCCTGNGFERKRISYK
jgi:hypothetical protein